MSDAPITTYFPNLTDDVAADLQERISIISAQADLLDTMFDNPTGDKNDFTKEVAQITRTILFQIQIIREHMFPE